MNLTTENRQPVGTQPAPGDSAFQTDSSAGAASRYYRISYLAQETSQPGHSRPRPTCRLMAWLRGRSALD